MPAEPQSAVVGQTPGVRTLVTVPMEDGKALWIRTGLGVGRDGRVDGDGGRMDLVVHAAAETSAALLWS